MLSLLTLPLNYILFMTLTHLLLDEATVTMTLNQWKSSI
jgi:hypothetical protein